jgi:hypothetical protein
VATGEVHHAGGPHIDLLLPYLHPNAP